MGLFKDIINGTKQLYKLKEGEYKGDVEQMYEASGELMRLLHNQAPGVNHTPVPFKDFAMVSLVGGRNEPSFGTAQATYLMPRDAQRQKFLETGYIDGTPGDYGLVKKAVGNKNLPVFQTAPDYNNITRDELIPIGNTGISKNQEVDESYFPIGIDKELFNAGNYPSTIYIDADGKLYRKSWDLNDYGTSTAGDSGVLYKGLYQLGANLLDKVGNPVVVTTGFQPVLKPIPSAYRSTIFYAPDNPQTIYNYYDNPIVKNWLNSNGRINIPVKDENGNIIAFSNILPQFEPVITAPSLH